MPTGPTRGAIVAGAMLGGLLLLVAEFTTLYHVHTSASSVPVRSVGTGSNNSYGLVPLAVLAALLGLAVLLEGSRPALLATGLVGVVALLIALLNDLPPAHATGLAGTAATHFLSATATPSAGLYLETLGAVVLIATCVLGFTMIGRPETGPRPRRSVS